MSMIQSVFAEHIFTDNLHELKSNKQKYIDHALSIKDKTELTTDWHCNTYNTIAMMDLRTDEVFKDIILETAKRVGEFSKSYGVDPHTVSCTDAWFNVAEPNNFQEFHIHPTCHFSSVYYISVPENSGNLLFKSHEANADMFPLPPANKDVIAARKVYPFYPKEQDLIIFRSNLQHMVGMNQSSEDRITFAMNFTVEPK